MWGRDKHEWANALWAKYQGKIYFTDDYDQHIKWLRSLGFKLGYIDFDKVLRGRIAIDLTDRVVHFQAYSGPISREEERDVPNDVVEKFFNTYKKLRGWDIEYERNPGRKLRKFPMGLMSSKQYGLMQAARSGSSYAGYVPREVAEEMIHRTPKGKRSKYMRDIMKARTGNGTLSKEHNAPFYTILAGGKTKISFTLPKAKTIAIQMSKKFGMAEIWNGLNLVSKIGNPGNKNGGSAESLSREFHGREPIEEVEITESESYESDLAQLGILTELEILSDDGEDVIPINFESDTEHIRLCSTPNGRQLEFVGGDQTLDLEEFEEAGLQLETGKRLVSIGSVHSISYYTDKHHLAGSKDQKDGIEFIHEFSEESNGELPMLVYDTEDEVMKLVGGRYRVEAEGIKD